MSRHVEQIVDLRKEAEVSKKETLEVRMLAEEQVVLLKQQLVAIRRALANTERESNDLRRLLDKEVSSGSDLPFVLCRRPRQLRPRRLLSLFLCNYSCSDL